MEEDGNQGQGVEVRGEDTEIVAAAQVDVRKFQILPQDSAIVVEYQVRKIRNVNF